MIWNFVYGAQLIFHHLIYYQLTKCLGLTGTSLNMLKKKRCTKEYRSQNVILEIT